MEQSDAYNWPKASKITIRPIENFTKGKSKSVGISYLVTVPAKVSGKGRIRRQFSDEKEARLWAERQDKGIKRGRDAYFALTDPERLEIGLMVPKLRKKGISITQAIQYAIDRIPDNGGERTLAQVVAELGESKQERYERGKLRDDTIRTFKYLTKRMLDVLGRDTLAHEITKEMLESYIGEMEGTDRTRKNYFRAANEVLNYAKQEGYIQSNPANEISNERRKTLYGGEEEDEEAEIGILTVQQVDDLLHHARDSKPEMLPFLVLAAFMGIRTAELGKLDWEKVNLETGFVTLDKSITKKRRLRHIPIPDNAKQWLLTIENRKGKVTPFAGTAWRNAFYRFTLGAGFKDADGRSTWVGNGLRHSFGSYHYALHGDSKETARLMGHRQGDQVLFDHYAALATKEQGKAYFGIVPTKQKKVVRFKAG